MALKQIFPLANMIASKKTDMQWLNAINFHPFACDWKKYRESQKLLSKIKLTKNLKNVIILNKKIKE